MASRLIGLSMIAEGLLRLVVGRRAPNLHLRLARRIARRREAQRRAAHTYPLAGEAGSRVD